MIVLQRGIDEGIMGGNLGSYRAWKGGQVTCKSFYRHSQ